MELLSPPNYSARECFMNNSRTGSDRDLIVFVLQRGHRGKSAGMKIDWPTNWPIRWILARDFDNNFSGLDFIPLKMVNTLFDRGSFYLLNKLLPSVPSHSVQELSRLQTDGEGFVNKSVLLEKVLRTSTITHSLVDLDELSTFCHRTWSPWCFLEKFGPSEFVRFLNTLPPFYINSISTFEWAEKDCLCSIDSSWDALQNHARTWSKICCTRGKTGVGVPVNRSQETFSAENS